ncbi:hypothetical protein [Novosphingobium sp.]|uniref:hypothetical protein n=1 Tax=Novosphingobium sp. TaxID=1874826 RepID=UPI0025EFB0B1|nr:hypothetical protein [Novosphingobium sp.]
MKQTFKNFHSLALAAAVTVGVLGLASTADARSRLTGEEELAKALAGREAGKPVDCIYLPTITSSHIIDRTAIVYESGRTLYVNRPRNGADQLNDSDIMVLNLHSSQLCSIDIVHLHDQTSHFTTGFVNLGEFVPYTKPKKVS